MNKRVTIEDVARASHVSVATVSLVMRGRTGINIETRKRVEQVARALGYQRRRSHREHHVQRISVLMRHAGANADSDPFFASMLRGVEDVCRRRGILNDIRHVTVSVDGQPTSSLFFPNYEYDGVIGIGVRADEYLHKHLRDYHLPFVTVDIDAPSHVFDSVAVDYATAIHELVSYLVTMGHRAIALIDGLLPTDAWRQTMCQTIANHGLTEPAVGTSSVSHLDVQDTLQRLLQQNPQISAIICRTDDLAMQVLTQLQVFGRFVPQHISVVGFDDTRSAVSGIPTLTTVRIDAHAMGVLATNTLLHRIEWPTMPRMAIHVDAALVIRQTTDIHVMDG